MREIVDLLTYLLQRFRFVLDGMCWVLTVVVVVVGKFGVEKATGKEREKNELGFFLLPP